MSLRLSQGARYARVEDVAARVSKKDVECSNERKIHICAATAPSECSDSTEQPSLSDRSKDTAHVEDGDGQGCVSVASTFPENDDDTSAAEGDKVAGSLPLDMVPGGDDAERPSACPSGDYAVDALARDVDAPNTSDGCGGTIAEAGNTADVKYPPKFLTGSGPNLELLTLENGDAVRNAGIWRGGGGKGVIFPWSD